MNDALASNPALGRFRAAVRDVYGANLERVVLYGSRARGDARPDSDYDVAVFLREMPDRVTELYRLADISTGILADTGAFIHAVAWRAAFIDDPASPIMHEIRREGVVL